MPADRARTRVVLGLWIWLGLGLQALASPPEEEPALEIPPVTSECGVASTADPLAPVLEALTALRVAGLRIERCDQTETRLQGRRLEIMVEGSAQELLIYRLELLAVEGFWIELTAAGSNRVLMIVRAAIGGGAVQYVRVDRISVKGRYLPGDGEDRVTKIAGLREGNFFPSLLGERLRQLGYSVKFLPVAAGELEAVIRPGRSLRRIRVHGAIPLGEWTVRRQLSADAQPGALARGNCVRPKELRSHAEPPPICDPSDVACRAWEELEITRLERFLFDSGYMRGTASLGLACGRESDEADLHVYLKKGRVHRISPRTVVDGAPTPADERWVRKELTPREVLVFRGAATRSFIEGSIEDVEAAFSDPNGALGRNWRSGREVYPHPEAEVVTNYEQLSVDNPPPGRDIDLEVQMELGPSVSTRFTPTAGAKALRHSQTRLAGQLQLFNRREPANPATAAREAANLRAFYQSTGHALASISATHQDFGSRQELRFQIREGPRGTVRGVRLSRNPQVPDDVLDAVDKARREDAQIVRRGRFSEAGAFSDLTTIVRSYQQHGYLCASGTLKVGFWKSGLAEPGAHARLDFADLQRPSGTPEWLSQFDADGLEGILKQARIGLWIEYVIEPGPRALTSQDETLRYLEEPIPPSRRTESVPQREEGQWSARRILERTPLRRSGSDTPGSVPITPDTDSETRRIVHERYRNSGFPVADAEVTWRVTGPDGRDTEIAEARDLVDPRLGICSSQANAASVAISPILSVYEGRRGQVGDLMIRGNFKTREGVLRRIAEKQLSTGQSYSATSAARADSRVEALDVADAVDVRPFPVGCDHADDDDCKVHHILAVDESEDIFMDIDFGVGSATLDPLFVRVHPKLPNLFGSAWDLDIDGRWGFNLQNLLEATELCAHQACYERMARVSLRRPQILSTPVDLDITTQFQRRVTPARGQVDTAFISPRLSWQISPEWTVYGSYLFQVANVRQDLVKPLGGSNADVWINRNGAVVPDRTGLIDTGVILTRVDNPTNPHDGFISTLDLKLASPWLGGLDWWARLDLRWDHFIPIPRTRDRLDFRYTLRYGHIFPFAGPGAATETAPQVWRYYGGGTADLGIRGILAETMLVDVEAIALPWGGTLFRPRAQGGHIRAIGTVAFQVVSVTNLLGGKLAHSIFYDFGVLAQRWDRVSLQRDYRHSIGVGLLKWDIDILTLALSYAILVPDWTDALHNVGPTDDPNGRFVFEVGVTF